MSTAKFPIQTLNDFLPPGAFQLLVPFFQNRPVKVVITHGRKSVLGDYRYPNSLAEKHRISINGDLNSYAFLVTLLHELAHLLAMEKYGIRIAPHGNEWKNTFKEVMRPFVQQAIFPEDILAALIAYFQRVGASTCSSPELYKVLRKYDKRAQQFLCVDDVPLNAYFKTEDGRVFQKINKRRTRYYCKEVASGKAYLFPGIYEVMTYTQEKSQDV